MTESTTLTSTMRSLTSSTSDATTGIDVYTRIRNVEQQGDYIEALRLRENAIAALVQDGEADRAEIALQAEELVKLYCCIALRMLNQNDFAEGFDLLLKAQRVVREGEGVLFSSEFDALRRKALAAVQNNLGLFYYRSGDYEAAVLYLQEAVHLERALGPSIAENAGATLSNLAQALSALRRFPEAISVLHMAVDALNQQAKAATVLLQVEDYANLLIHCHAALGRCHEELGRFHQAAEAFSTCVKHLKLGPAAAGIKSHAADYDTRIRKFHEDIRRCQEKASRLPNIPLRSTRPPPQISPRDQRGTKANTHRLQMASGHPSLQHEKIVTTTVAMPSTHSHRWHAPPPPAHPTAAAVPQNRFNVAAADRSPLQPPTPLPHPVTQMPFPLIRPTNDHNDEEGVDNHDDDAPAESLVPIGVRDVTLSSGQRVVPQETAAMLGKSDKGLNTIYHQLDPKFQEAFDSLVHLSSGAPTVTTPTTTRPATIVMTKQNAVVTPPVGIQTQTTSAVVSAANEKNTAAMPPLARTSVAPPSQHRSTLRPTSARPSVAPSGGSATRVTSVSGPRRPSSAKQPSGRASLPSTAPITSNSAATIVASPKGIASGATGFGSQPEGSDPERVALEEQRRQQVFAYQQTISRCWSSYVSSAVTARRSKDVYEKLVMQRTLRQEEAHRAMLMAQEVLRQERSRMQRELQEAQLLIVSRRRTTQPLGFSHNTEDAVTSAVSDSVCRQQELNALHQRVRSAFTAHAASFAIKEEVVEAVQELQVELQRQKSEIDINRHNMAIMIQRFAQLALARQITSTRVSQTRTHVLREYANSELRRRSRIKIEEFLLSSMLRRREALQLSAEEHRVFIRRTLQQVMIACFARSRLSVMAVGTAQFLRRMQQRVLLQRCGRGYFDRCVMVYRARERAAERAWTVEHSGRVILRALRKNVKRIKGAKRWEEIVASNWQNRRSFSATKIQAVWRGYRVRPALQEQWRANLTLRRRAEALALETKLQSQEMLHACIMLQRAYRHHLARREIRYLKRLHTEAAFAYFTHQWKDTAVRRLQVFCRIVRAKGVVRRKRESEAASLRVRRQLFDMEEEDKRIFELQKTSRLIQRVGRAYLYRSAMSFISCGHRLPPSREFSFDGIAAPLVITRSGSGSGIKRGKSVDSVVIDRDISSSPSSSRACPSPSLYNFERTLDKSVTTSFSRAATAFALSPQALESTLQLIRGNNAHVAVSSGTNGIQLSFFVSPRGKIRHDALKKIISFFRRVIRKKRAKERKDAIRQATIRNEAARFIQDAWLRFVARQRQRDRTLKKKEEWRQTLEVESAIMIQRSFRRFAGNQPHQPHRSSPRKNSFAGEGFTVGDVSESYSSVGPRHHAST